MTQHMASIFNVYIMGFGVGKESLSCLDEVPDSCCDLMEYESQTVVALQTAGLVNTEMVQAAF